MEVGGFYSDDSLMESMMNPCGSDILLDPKNWAPDSYPSFHAPAGTLNFEGDDRPYLGQIESDANDNNGYKKSGRKTRLSPDQVRYLEKSFEAENKLDPEKKIHLAKELELQPKQIAIWFQNRRARCKMKILERKYSTLKASYDELHVGYNILRRENETIKYEVNLLNEKLVYRENVLANPKASDPIFGGSPIESQLEKPDFPMIVAQKQEDTLSDVFDSESPHSYNNRSFAAALLLDETANSSYVFGKQDSGFSQVEDSDLLSRSFPKIEDVNCDVMQPTSGDSEVQDQGTWFRRF